MNILHIAEPQTFTKPFFSLIEKNFEVADHAILTRGKSNCWPSDLKIANKTLSGFFWAFTFLKSARKAKKIILHGLWDFRLVMLLALHPSLLKKCYWVIWGGDLYQYKFRKQNIKHDIYEAIRAFVIKRIGHFVTYVEGDYELAQQWSGATGQHHECIMYTSNIYRDYKPKAQFHDTVNIQIGNSADPSNNHFDIIEKLKPFQDMDIAIYAPLSYGDPVHAEKVINAGKAIFGDKFKPMTDFMPLDQYLEFLGKIDVAVFNHKRQQAMGNTITLLGLGKKVYMRSDVTPWFFFKTLGITVFDVSKFDFETFNQEKKQKNNQLVKKYFSQKNLIKQLHSIFTI